MLDKNINVTRKLGIALDVRGTLVHCKNDLPTTGKIASLILKALKFGCYISILSAGSIQTIKRLVLNKLIVFNKKSASMFLCRNLVVYSDSATKGWRINEDNKIVPLTDYQAISFDRDELEKIIEIIESAKIKFKIKKPRLKLKAGQINFYMARDFNERIEIADYLNKKLANGCFREVRAFVPSSKETIDIALCGKIRGIKDFAGRFRLKKLQISIISDSLQDNGAEQLLKRFTNNSLSFQVGVHHASNVINYPNKIDLEGTTRALERLVTRVHNNFSNK
ncbi:MAG: hypothetical protein WC858_04320 [Parcubacteria group bacterium]|jgi:hypothetical protein